MPAFKDISGKRFGRWHVLSRGETKASRVYWNCRCDCGTERQVSGCHLSSGASSNCGCGKGETASRLMFKHGLSDTPEHNIWMGMVNRCTNPNNSSWDSYGGRGIKVCERWLASFEAFLSDVGPRPSPKHSIDRRDGSGNYEPGNVRWATKKEQARNISRNRFVELDGSKVTLAEACERTGINYGSAKWRLNKGYDWRGL